MNGGRLQVAGAVLAAALAGSGCVSTGEFEKLQADKNQEIDGLQKQRAGLEQQTRELQSQRAALERQQGDLRAERDTLAQQKAQLEAANQQTRSQYDGLVR